LTPDQFWALSPRELYREFAAENARRRNAANRDARLAYLVVSIWVATQNKKRMPPLRDYLVTDQPDEAAPDAKLNKLRAAMHVLSAQYGLPLRPHTRPADGE